jgi:hypothetical protein
VAKRGTPSGLIATVVFQNLAVSEMAALGATGLPLLVIQHPLGGEKPESVSRARYRPWAAGEPARPRLSGTLSR